MKGKCLLGCIIASGIGLFLATVLVPNVWIEGDNVQLFKTLLFAGIVLGLINLYIKPAIKIVTFPLKYVTLGLIGLFVNIAIIWGVDILFPELHIKGFLALFLTSLLIWVCNLFVPKKKKQPKAPQMEPIE